MSGPGDVAPERSRGEPTWLSSPAGELLAWLHHAPAGAARDVGVVFCPPFGWDEEKSYRGRRVWADRLASAGHPTVRFDLPGTGDSSGSPRDPARLDAWTEAVTEVARWLRERTGCGRVTGLGIGLGGMLAWRAAAGGAEIDDLILWGVPDSGRRLLRQIRAAAQLIAGARLDYVRELDAGDMEAVGYRLTAETIAELGALRLSDLALPDARRRRVLLLSAGALQVDAPLREHLEGSGVELSVEEGPGHAELMLDPERSEVPAATVERTISWLAGAPAPAPAGAVPERPRAAGPALEPRDSIELEIDGTPICERLFRPQTPDGRLFGIVAEPAGDAACDAVGAVIFNTGAIRHTGPNRNAVELARRWAAVGIRTLRIDLAGLGDADGDSELVRELDGMYDERRIAEAARLLERVEEAGLPERVIVFGLCAGGYLAMHAAVRSDRIAALFLVNQTLVSWDRAVVEQASTRTALQSLGGRSWRRLLRGEVTVADIRRQLAKLRLDRVLASAWHGADRRQLRAARHLFAQLAARRVRVVMLFAEDEPLLALLTGNPRVMRAAAGAVELASVPDADHTFRLVHAQQQLLAHAEAFVRELIRNGAGAQIVG